MTYRTRISVAHCRPGARIQFDTFPGRKQEGVVDFVVVTDPYEYLLYLREYTDKNGVVHVGADPMTNAPHAVNLCHACAVLEPGKGPVQYHKTASTLADYARQSLKKAFDNGAVRRHGNKLFFDGRVQMAVSTAREFMRCYLDNNSDALGIRPDEVMDELRVMRALESAGVLRHAPSGEPRAPFWQRSLVLDTKRMRRFMQQNVNRLKLSVKATYRQQLEDDLDEREMIRAEGEAEMLHDLADDSSHRGRVFAVGDGANRL